MSVDLRSPCWADTEHRRLEHEYIAALEDADDVFGANEKIQRIIYFYAIYIENWVFCREDDIIICL